MKVWQPVYSPGLTLILSVRPMKFRPALRAAFHFLIAAGGCAGLLFSVAWLFRPDLSKPPPAPTPAEVEAARQAREFKIDPDNPLVLYRHVDYSEGSSGAWYPKGESPIVAELVQEGKLPPVAQRVGNEPAVVEGVEGIGRYGGTWMRAAPTDSDAFALMGHRLAYPNLVRWSPHGYPIVPHAARQVEFSGDYRRFIFTLRKGMKWSDGHPFTADDILYWWNDEVLDRAVGGGIPPQWMKPGSAVGTIQKLDDHRLLFTFPNPHGLFLMKLASSDGVGITGSPAHYLRRYHPTHGDQELIRREIKARKLADPLALYQTLKQQSNPEHPRLGPWIYRTPKSNPPYCFVRNPYYWMVDTAGNQLPYVDRLHFDVRSFDMITSAATNGQLTMQDRALRYDQYTLLMGERKANGYEVRHWQSGESCDYVFIPNLNLRVDPDRPETAKKRALLGEKKFRQALSLAMDRQAIIEAEYNGQTKPSQVMPPEGSYFHEPELAKRYTQHDPRRAGELLDQLGLTARDNEGFRTFADGSRMTFYLSLCEMTPPGPARFAIEDWASIGLRVVLQVRSRQLWSVENGARDHELTVWTSDSEFIPLLSPRYFLPNSWSQFALGYGKWYDRGGLTGDPLAQSPGCEEPPPGHPLREALEIYERTGASGDRAVQREIFRPVLEIYSENLWSIGLCTAAPTLAVVKDGFRNVPKDVVFCWCFLSPGNAGMETYFFESPSDSPGTIAQIKQSLVEVIPQEESAVSVLAASGKATLVGSIIRYSFLAAGVLLAVLIALRHPYIMRRIVIMVPTMLVISVLVFTVIQAPPGDYLTSRIMQLRQAGEHNDIQRAEAMLQQFHLDEPPAMRYLRWVGLRWFVTFAPGDEGLLQGNLGRSMETGMPVNKIVGDRITLTVFISLGAILMTWAVAIPTGIYSAVRQYSPGDYVLTFLGFLGMCVPPFLLALVLMYLSKRLGGLEVSGLFSSQYGAQAEWDWPKVLDLLRHIWLPVVVLGVGGTASMIRVMRGNLLDELKKPYVTTAMAKGVRPVKLLLKYPVRLALNPFVSGIGGLFPQLVSGGAIVAIVLSLPTVGPLMLGALMNEDMYLAGSMLMVLSLMGLVGTLISDLLLLWLDPRIRFQGGNS